MAKMKFAGALNCLAYHKPEFVGKVVKIVGTLDNERNWVHDYDQVVKVDGKLYDCAGRLIGRKKWSIPWFIGSDEQTIQ